MDDQLKQFIGENREAFDSESPDKMVFTKIKMQINGAVTKEPFWRSIRWAAVFSGIIILSAAFYFFQGNNRKNATIPVADKPGTIQEDISFIGDATYAKQIYHFKELIGLKQAELDQLKTEYPDLYRQFVDDITELDSSYQSLKTNLAENPNREILLEAMIQNLQLQSELLNRQLMIIKKIKQKTKSHVQTSI